MNLWKVGFFLLAGSILAGIIYIIVMIGSVADSEALPKAKEIPSTASVLTVQSTKKDLEGIANSFIYRAMEEDMDIQLAVEDEIILSSELIVFSYRLPVKMHFNPVVLDDGNLMLKQSSLELGQLNLPPSTVLKVLKDSSKLPPWMIVRPKEEEIFIDLDDLPISGDLKVRAKEVNLKEDEIILEIVIPENMGGK